MPTTSTRRKDRCCARPIYKNPADLAEKYPQFYWTKVAPQIQLAIRYLNVTSSGRQWIANLHSNVFRAEREVNLSGPER